MLSNEAANLPQDQSPQASEGACADNFGVRDPLRGPMGVPAPNLQASPSAVPMLEGRRWFGRIAKWVRI